LFLKVFIAFSTFFQGVVLTHLSVSLRFSGRKKGAGGAQISEGLLGGVLMATIRRSGTKWRAELKVSGMRDSKTFENRAKASRWSVEREIELRALAGGTSLTHTVGDACDRYAREVSPNKRGAKWEFDRLAAFGRDPIASIKLIDLKANDIQDYINRRLLCVKSSTVNRELNLLGPVLNTCRRWGWLKESPMNPKDIDRPKNPPPRERRITDTEIKRICFCLNYELGAEAESTRSRVALAFLFALETGMRAGEICNLMGEHVSGRVAHLPMTKNGRKRDVPLSLRASEIIDEVQPVASNGKTSIFGLKSGSLSQIFMQATSRANIDNITFHDSRHEAVTRLAGKINVMDLARMIGHTDIRQLMTYYDKSASDIVAQLD